MTPKPLSGSILEPPTLKRVISRTLKKLKETCFLDQGVYIHQSEPALRRAEFSHVTSETLILISRQYRAFMARIGLWGVLWDINLQA